MNPRVKRLLSLILALTVLFSLIPPGTVINAAAAQGAGVQPGDINGDGAVNNKDLTRLFQFLSDWDVEVVEATLDINGDGAQNNKDLTRLFQYLSDWDVEIHGGVEPSASAYHVIFETNGGSAIAPAEVEKDTLVERPENPVREGFYFVGWYSDTELTIAYDFTKPVTGEFTLYAKWEEPYIQITLDDGGYGNHVVNRTITGSVTHNVPIESITYELVGAYSTKTGEVAMADADIFEIYALLQDGENVLTVTAQASNGMVVSESLTLSYDSGHVFTSGENAEEIVDKLISLPIYYTEDTSEEPTQYLISNILNLYFHNSVSFKERIAFITDVLGGEVAGYLNALDMMQVLLPDMLSNAEAIGYTGETNLANISVTELREYADKLVVAYGEMLESAYTEFIYTDLTQAVTTNDPWDNCKWDNNETDDWWLKLINAYDAWEYDDYHNSDFLRDINLGVVDGGFLFSHLDLVSNIERVSEEDSVHDHGTHVAGIMIAEANNGEGIAGVMHNNGYLYAYDGLKESSYYPWGNYFKPDSSVLEGLSKTVESGAQIINFSLSRSKNIPAQSYELEAAEIKDYGKRYSQAIGELLSKKFDFIVVQSAGNGNKDGIGVNYWNSGYFSSINEANCYFSKKDDIEKQDIMDRIVIVSATCAPYKKDDPGVVQNNVMQMASFSNGNGDGGELNIIAAPGEHILSASANEPLKVNGTEYKNQNEYYKAINLLDLYVEKNRPYAYMSGTSMAAPIVTAVCGLTWSANLELTGAEVVELVVAHANCGGVAANPVSVETNGEVLSVTKGGMGIVNAEKAVYAAIQTRTTYTLGVVDELTEKGISATIKIHKDGEDGLLVGKGQDGNQIYYSESNGSFVLPKLPAGSYWIEISADGYATSWKSVYLPESKLEIKDLGTIYLTPNIDYTKHPSYIGFTTPNAAPLRVAPGIASDNLGTTTAGEEFTSTALCEDSEGNLWYEVNRNGQVCYIHGGDTANHKTDLKDITISDVVAPTNLVQGYPFSIGGTIATEYTLVNMVSAHVYSEDGTEILSPSETVNHNRYELSGNDLDNGLKFAALKEGAYTYKVKANTVNYYTTDGTTLKKVVTPHELYCAEFTVGSHVCRKDKFVFYEAAHPHYNCYQCNSCGMVTAWQDEPNVIEGCEACRPGKPVLNVAVDNTTGTVTFTWDDVENTTHYALWILKKDADGNWQYLEQNDVEVSGATRTLENGEYRAQLLAYNGNLWEEDGSDYVHTWAEDVDFTVEIEPIEIIAEGTCGENLTWVLTSDGALTISGEGYMTTYLWTSEAPWYEYRESIISVTMDNRVTSIGGRAFNDCSNLQTIQVSSAVEYIDNYAFHGCASLGEIKLPDGLIRINSCAFNICSSLSSIIIPDTVTFIGDLAFCACTNLREITLPEGITSIGSSAFSTCESLTSLDLPSTVTEIGGAAFDRCSNLRSINIPDGVTSIGANAFSGCTSLTEIDIPDSVSSIGDAAFFDCSSLRSINLSSGIVYIRENTFVDCTSLTEIDIPASVTSIGKSAFHGCTNLSSIVLPVGITHINREAFSGCTNLSAVTFQGDAPEIGEQIFSGVTATAYYPEGNTTWDDAVMQNYGGTITWVPYEPDTCTHKNVVDSISATNPPRYEQSNDKQHLVWHTMCKYCQDCHTQIPDGEETVTGEDHVLDDKGVCNYCGYGAGENYCTHPGTELMWDTNHRMTYTSKDNSQHIVEGYQYHYCTACFKRISASFPISEIVDHEFDTFGDCTLCGYRAGCTHSETTKKLYNTLYECLDQQNHEETTLYSKVCANEDCGKVLLSVDTSYTEIRQETHTFDKDSCTLCGYTVSDELRISVATVGQTAIPGESISASAAVVGGTGGYCFNWKVLKDGTVKKETELGTNVSYDYPAEEEGSYVLVVTVQDSSGNTATAETAAITVKHVCEYEILINTELINQDMLHHDIATTSYQKCTICHEETDPAVTAVSEDHSAERYGYETAHPHEKFFVCKCGAHPYVEGAHNTANGNVQEPEVCCICNGHQYGEAVEVSEGLWQKTCVNCNITKNIAAPNEPTEPDVPETEPEYEAPEDVSTIFCKHEYCMYYDSQLNAHFYCKLCQPRTIAQQEEDAQNLERYIVDEGLRINADKARYQVTSMNEPGALILQSLHDWTDGAGHAFAGCLYNLAIFKPGEAIKQLWPGSVNVNKIRKEIIQAAISNARIADVRSNGVLQNSSYKDVVKNELAESVSKVLDNSDLIYDTADSLFETFVTVRDFVKNTDTTTNSGKAFFALGLFTTAAVDIRDYKNWSEAQQELFFASLYHTQRNIDFLKELEAAFPEDKILVEYCIDTRKELEDVRDLKVAIDEAGTDADYIVELFDADVVSGTADVVLPEVFIRILGKGGGLVVLFGTIAGILDELVTGTGTTIENLEDIEVLYEVIEQSFYGYRDIQNDPNASDIVKRFQEYNILYMKMASMEMAGKLNKGEIKGTTDEALANYEIFEKMMLYEDME